MTRPKSDSKAIDFSISSPGRLIKELMESRQVDAIDLAYDLGLSQNEFSDLLIGDIPLTEEIAVVLGRTFHMPASIWLTAEQKYRNH